MTERRIRNIAEHYVGARECSAEMLRVVLHRRGDGWIRSLPEDQQERETEKLRDLIEREVSRMVRLGYIDDHRYARIRVRSGLASGRGLHRIAREISMKGVDGDVVQDALREGALEFFEETHRAEAFAPGEGGIGGREGADPALVSVQVEREAADRHARKRGLGPYRRGAVPEDRAERAKLWRREASSFARAGFNMDIIRELLDAAVDPDEFSDG